MKEISPAGNGRLRDFSDILIITDLDGTFFGKDSRLVPRNLEAVERFKAGGGFFTLATGRMHCNMMKDLPVAAELVNAPMSACNGALLCDIRAWKSGSEGEGEWDIIEEHPIDSGLGMEIHSFVKSISRDTGFRISSRSGFLTSEAEMSDCSMVTDDIDSCYEGGYLIADPREWEKYVWYKIVIRGECGRLDSIRPLITERFGDRITVSKSGKNHLEIQSAGVTKAKSLPGLRAYCERQCGRPVTVFACGDYENDITMLRAADVGVCPSNAGDDVKKAAGLCLCSNDEGLIADLVEKIEAGTAGC